MIFISPIDVKQAWPIRHKVMNNEHSVTPSGTNVDKDKNGEHFGLFESDELVSVASVYREGDDMQFRKFATIEEKRNKGYGRKLLQHVIDHGHNSGAKRLWFNAIEGSADFYHAMGFTETEQTFIKDGNKYIVVEMKL